MAKLNHGITVDPFNTFINKLNITSNDGGEPQSLIDANPVAFKYTEHLFRDSIEAEIIFKDTGGKYNGKSLVEGLPVVGTEDLTLYFKD